MVAAGAAAAHAVRQVSKQRQTDTFNKYDVDGSGSIDAHELQLALSELGMEASSAEVEAILQKYTAQGGESEKTLDLAGFSRLVTDLYQHRRAASKAAGKALRPEYLPYEHKVRAFYQTKSVTIFFATLILANFAINCIEKEIDPGTTAARTQNNPALWEDFDRFFNIVFLIELLMNIWGCGGPFRPFWSSGWNCFDFFIVAVGVVFMSGAIPPDNPLSNLKMLRAFRVFRLFKRIESLNKIIVALLRSLPGVFNAFVIMVIFMMIYAILAVEYFAPLGQEFGEHGLGQYVTFGDNGENHTISAETARGFSYGWEYYGTFFRAMYTLFQVMTGESWSEAVARPLMFGLYRNAFLVSFYFVSFILLMQIVLTNVVVAVLLDKFVAEEPSDESGAGGEGDPTASVSPADFLGSEGGIANVKPVAAWSMPIESETSTASSAQQMVGSPPATRDEGSGAALEAKLGLILQELAALRKDVSELKQEKSMAAEDLP